MSVRWFLLLISLIFCSAIASGQAGIKTSDSIVYFHELQYTSKAEQEAFAWARNFSDEQYLQIALNAQITQPVHESKWYLDLYKELIRKIESQNFAELKPEKQVKIIYARVQENVLKKYDLGVTFEKLFINGNYNCATATMLYGIVLTRFNIPFEIKETPEHVFLVANTGKNSTLLESTNPVQGYINYNEAFKENFIQYLKESKTITPEEIAGKGNDSLFNRYFFQQTSINLKQLAGILYYNNAVFFLQVNNLKAALDQLQKSYFLYPVEKSSYLMRGALALLLINAAYLDEEEWKYFIYLSRFRDSFLNNESFKNEFARLTQKLLVEKSNLEKYRQAYKYINDHIVDSSLKKDISFVYHAETGRYLITSGRDKEAFPYIEQAYKLNPDNYEVYNMFISTFITLLDNYAEDESITMLEKYYAQYDKLRGDLRISRLMTGVYLYRASSCFEAGHWTEGDAYLKKFEKMMDQCPDKHIFFNDMENVYTRVAGYYFKQNNQKKTKEYILRGLKYCPVCPTLKRSLESVQ